jgi:hypothetical protein
MQEGDKKGTSKGTKGGQKAGIKGQKGDKTASFARLIGKRGQGDNPLYRGMSLCPTFAYVFFGR